MRLNVVTKDKKALTTCLSWSVVDGDASAALARGRGVVGKTARSGTPRMYWLADMYPISRQLISRPREDGVLLLRAAGNVTPPVRQGARVVLLAQRRSVWEKRAAPRSNSPSHLAIDKVASGQCEQDAAELAAAEQL